MKTFFRKHKTVLIALACVLCVGVLTGLVIGGTIRLSMTERAFTTVAEASKPTEAPQTEAPQTESEQASEPAASETPANAQPTPTPSAKNEIKLSAEEVRRINETVQDRRRYAIPIRSGIWICDNRFLWTEEKPTAEQTAAAREAAERYAQILFGKSFRELTMTPVKNATVQLFQDTQDVHDDFIRVTDADGELILTLNAADMRLICADLLTYPEAAATSNRDKENLALAEQLGYRAKRSGMLWASSPRENILTYTTDTDVCLSFSCIGDKLWQVGVYPSKQAMDESEYFLADVQFDYKTPAYPKRFVEAEAPKLGIDKMLPADKIVIRLKRLYHTLNGAELSTDSIRAKFYRDESGAREDCWEITGGGFHIVVSAYSRNVIRFTGSIRCKDLIGIPYEDMGGEEYETVARTIGEELFTKLAVYDKSGDAHGRAVKSVSLNAIYDYHYCTMDVELEDGTIYECYFKDGVLKEIWYFADEGMFGVGLFSGWVADAVYINSAGRQFIPDYRSWDGELHVIHRDESHEE